MHEPADSCEQLVREADKDRFIATLFAPPPLRSALFALYAFNVEIGRIREVARQPLAGEIRLQWWRDALGGLRSEEARGNPVAARLLDAAAARGLSASSLLDLIDARAFDLYDEAMRSLTELEDYLGRSEGALIELAAGILGASGEQVAEAARHAGVAYGMALLLNAFPRQAARRHMYLPREILDRHQARPDTLLARPAAPPVLSALAELRGHAREHLMALRERLPSLPSSAGPAFLPVSLVEPMLARMERRSDSAAQGTLPQWRRQWIMWRAARRGLARLV
jgi:phytoene synthase